MDSTRAAVAEFLASADSIYRGAVIEVCTPLSGGQSTSMRRCVVRRADGVKESFVLRADAAAGAGASPSGSRAAEWALLNALVRLDAVRVPRPRYFDARGVIGGAPTIVSDYVDGEPLAKLAAGASALTRRQYAKQVAEIAAHVHRVPLGSLPSWLVPPDSWHEYIDGVLRGVRDAERSYAGSDPFIRRAAAFLDTNRPTPTPLTLVHGDLQASNLLLARDGRLVLIDWGARTRIGDPREDIGQLRKIAAAMPPDLTTGYDDTFIKTYQTETGLSQDVINEWSITYFVLFACVQVAQKLLAQAGAVAGQHRAGVNGAFGVLAQIFHHQQIQRALARLREERE